MATYSSILFFLYDIIHVLMPFSQIIPLSLSHRVQKIVLYMCLFCCPADEWIRKLWYIYTMEYYLAIKKNTFEPLQYS